MAQPRFDEQLDARFEEDLNRARGYKPVTRKELRQAYKQYGKVGLKFRQVKKSQSDEDLYARATKIVLKWWKMEQKEKVERKRKIAEAKRNAQRDPLRGAESDYRGSGGWGGSGGGGGSGSGMLPDTAMDEGKPARGYLKPDEARQILREMGVPDAWDPPMEATTSQRALEQWVTRLAEKRDFIFGRNQSYFDTNVVRRIGRQMGIRGIDWDKVPRKYRNTIGEIRAYMRRIKNLQRLNETRDRQEANSPNPSRKRRRTSAPDTVERRGGLRPGL